MSFWGFEKIYVSEKLILLSRRLALLKELHVFQVLIQTILFQLVCTLSALTCCPGPPGKLVLESHCSPCWVSQGSWGVQASPSCLAHTWQQPQSNIRGTGQRGMVGGHWHGPVHSWHITYSESCHSVADMWFLWYYRFSAGVDLTLNHVILR